MDASKTKEIHSALVRRIGPRRALDERLVERLERDCAAGERRDGDVANHPSRWPAWTDNFYFSADLD